MERGFTFESFASLIEASEDDIDGWLDHKEFEQSRAIGEAKCRKFWEQMGIAGATGQLKDFHYITWHTTMKNRYGYS